jgi:cAMP-dependent protein kinase regulator
MEEDESAVTPASAATPSFPKSPEQLQRIRDAISPNFLFRNLDDEQEADVLAAMKEVTLGPNEIVIEQGAAGDYFYVVESGELNIFVKRDGQVIDADKGDDPVLGKKVATSVKGNSFGELALMHK